MSSTRFCSTLKQVIEKHFCQHTLLLNICYLHQFTTRVSCSKLVNIFFQTKLQVSCITFTYLFTFVSLLFFPHFLHYPDSINNHHFISLFFKNKWVIHTFYFNFRLLRQKYIKTFSKLCKTTHLHRPVQLLCKVGWLISHRFYCKQKAALTFIYDWYRLK